MAGFGVQKKGTSPLLVKRKGFNVGGDVDSDYLYQGETEEGTKVVYGEKPSKDLLKETEKIKPVNVPDKRINLKPDKNVKPTKALIEESDLSKEKPPKEEEKLQFRCAGPNPTKKCGHRDEKKKGGKPGLWANINARKKAGTSRSKSESTISSKAYANMKAGFPKKGKK